MTTLFPLIPLLPLILGSSFILAAPPADEPQTPQPNTESQPFASATDLLDALAKQDQSTNSLIGTIRFTDINALENDRQQRLGNLSIATLPDSDQRLYAVSFTTLLIDDRQESIAEHYIFDGRWFVERMPEEKQFNKRELVPVGQTLDPMELMRQAPFWVSLGKDQDRLLKSYNAQIVPSSQILIDNPDFPELAYLAPTVQSAIQLKLTPKEGSGFEDDWEWVRIWINPKTLNPMLYIKAQWTGDLQIVELFAVQSNVDIPAEVFDTTSPDPRSGWHVQISPWRGQPEKQIEDQPNAPMKNQQEHQREGQE